MDNKTGIDIPKTGWESIMQTYPYTIKYNDRYWVFYNGNGFGKTGFGYAVFERED